MRALAEQTVADVRAALEGRPMSGVPLLPDAASEHQRRLLYAYVRVAQELDDRLAPVLVRTRSLLRPDDIFSHLADRLAHRVARRGGVTPLAVFEAPPAWLVDELTRVVRRRARIDDPVPMTPLTGLRSTLYEHPDDRVALDALRAIPGFDRIVSMFIDHYASYLELRLLASNIEATAESMPELYRLFSHVCRTIDVPQPPLYIEPGPLNAYTTGTDRPIVVISQSMLSLFTPAELCFVLGHELGHIKSGHVLYYTMARQAAVLAQLIGQFSLGIGDTVFRLTVMPALYYWQRRSEFTADRAGLLACQDPGAAISVMAKFAGLPLSGYRDFDPADFVDQARRLDARLDTAGLDRILLMLDTVDDTHPRTVWRAATLQRWLDSGEYDDIYQSTAEQRHYLDAMLGDDPLILPFVDDVVDTIVSWTAPATRQLRDQRRRLCRRMLRLGEAPRTAPLDDVFVVEVELGWASGGTMRMTVRLLALVGGRPTRVELQASRLQSWSSLPQAARDALMKTGERSVTYCLYKRSA